MELAQRHHSYPYVVRAYNAFILAASLRNVGRARSDKAYASRAGRSYGVSRRAVLEAVHDAMIGNAPIYEPQLLANAMERLGLTTDLWPQTRFYLEPRFRPQVTDHDEEDAARLPQIFLNKDGQAYLHIFYGGSHTPIGGKHAHATLMVRNLDHAISSEVHHH